MFLSRPAVRTTVALVEPAFLLVNALALLAVAAQAYFVRKQVEVTRTQWREQSEAEARRFETQLDRLDRQLAEATALRREDHERRKKQATIEYWTSLSDSRRDFRQLVFERFGTEVLARSVVEDLAARDSVAMRTERSPMP